VSAGGVVPFDREVREPHLDAEQEPEPGRGAPSHSPPAPGSVLEAVLSKRQEELGERTYDVDVPGYGGQLVLRLQPLPPGQLSKITARAQKLKPGEREMAANTDLLVAACVEVLGRRAPGAELEPLLPGETLRIDEQLGQTLQMTAKTARGLLLELFGKANDPVIAVGVAAGEFAEWCAQANEDVSENLLGESPAARE